MKEVFLDFCINNHSKYFTCKLGKKDHFSAEEKAKLSGFSFSDDEQSVLIKLENSDLEYMSYLEFIEHFEADK